MKSLFVFSLVAFLASCNERPSERTNDAKPVADTTVAAVALPRSASGYYEGVFPCTDCQGIQQKLLILAGNKVRTEETKMGTNAAPLSADGSWRLDDSLLTVSAGGKSMVYYYQDSLLVVRDSAAGQRLGREAAQYRLHKKALGSGNKAWMKKAATGTDFLALGTEPFWSLEIDADTIISFIRADNKVPLNVPYMNPTVGGNTKIFKVNSSATQLTVTVSNEFCSDGMSDTWYEYAVTVVHNDTTYKGCGVRLSTRWDSLASK
jgi:uncharacterized membrane protein